MIRFFKRLLKKDYGVALGGGGTRSAAHVGALKAIQESDIEINYISGTSSGSVVAALYAFGIDLNMLEAQLGNSTIFKWSSLLFKGPGFFNNDTVEKIIDALLPEDANIEDAQIPLAIHATDLISGKGVNLIKGNLKQALLASCAIPGIYIPISWENYLLTDGGLTENVPLSALRDFKASGMLGINLNGAVGYVNPQSALEVITNAMDIAIDSKTHHQMRQADIQINLELSHLSRTAGIDYYKLVDAGYQQTIQYLSNK